MLKNGSSPSRNLLNNWALIIMTKKKFHLTLILLGWQHYPETEGHWENYMNPPYQIVIHKLDKRIYLNLGEEHTVYRNRKEVITHLKNL